MAWYDEAVFYHIYPLGLTGAPKQNDYGEPVHRLNSLLPWVGHLKKLGFTALYIGPLFQSVGHGYETTDYRLLDSRLGTNEDLKNFVAACHETGLRVIFDGVFNHTGRDFFAFRDIRENREGSVYRDWYCNVNFGGNNEYNDGFSYDNWGGYNLLVKLNQRNPAVRDYICSVIRFWVSEFDVDGIRLDAADVLDFEFMKALRRTADEVKPDFWLMGEVIHGDYSRWANEDTLHSVTNYALHKALYSGHNDHNYFEIAHTVRRTNSLVPPHIKLYNFVDNHDVERIHTKLVNKAHVLPVHILLYTLPGIPSVYYGSEFGIDGRKERRSDDSLRPYIDLDSYRDAYQNNSCTALIASLGAIHSQWKQDLVWGEYRELSLTTQQYVFSRGRLIVAVNNADSEVWLNVEAGSPVYIGLLSGRRIESRGSRLTFSLSGADGDIFAPDNGQLMPELPVCEEIPEPVRNKPKALRREEFHEPIDPTPAIRPAKKSEPCRAQAEVPEKKSAMTAVVRNPVEMQKAETRPEDIEIPDLPYDLMTVEQLQAVILAKMAKNGPVTERMRRDVIENIWHDSLVNWANSFR